MAVATAIETQDRCTKKLRWARGWPPHELSGEHRHEVGDYQAHHASPILAGAHKSAAQGCCWQCLCHGENFTSQGLGHEGKGPEGEVVAIKMEPGQRIRIGGLGDAIIVGMCSGRAMHCAF